MSLSIEIASERSGLSWKTTKALYIDLRERLFHPHFNRWHKLNTHADFESFRFLMQDMTQYFQVLGKCASNKTCHRNYHLGNRASKVCRNCPLLETLDLDHAERSVATLHYVQDFYKQLDWRAEHDLSYGFTMMMRTYHKIVFDTAYDNSKFATNGLPRFDDEDFLSVATLFRTMIGSLARYPLRSEFEEEPWGTPLPSEPIDPNVMAYLFFN